MMAAAVEPICVGPGPKEESVIATHVTPKGQYNIVISTTLEGSEREYEGYEAAVEAIVFFPPREPIVPLDLELPRFDRQRASSERKAIAAAFRVAVRWLEALEGQS